MKKIIVILILIVVLFFLALFKKEGLPKVAACPTFYYMLEKLEKEGIETIRTESTGESLRLLEEKEVDLVISGRGLKKGEPNFLFEKIGPGYDFFFQKELVIFEKEMEFVPFYTNLSKEKIREDFPYINSLEKVEDLGSFLDQGIIITNNEIKGETVHIFKEEGSRVRLSRLPRLYYFDSSRVDLVRTIVKEN